MTSQTNSPSPLCSQCGFQPPSQAIFCPKCGNNLKVPQGQKDVSETINHTLDVSATLPAAPSPRNEVNVTATQPATSDVLPTEATSDVLSAGATRQIAPLTAEKFQEMVKSIQGPAAPDKQNHTEAPLPPLVEPLPTEDADARRTAMLGPEVQAQVAVMLEESIKAAAAVDKTQATASGDPAATAMFGSDVVESIKAAVDKAQVAPDHPVKQETQPATPIKADKTSTHSAAQLAEFSFSSIARVVQELQQEKKAGESQTKAGQTGAVEPVMSPPQHTMEATPLTSPKQAAEDRDESAESQDSLPFYTAEHASFSAMPATAEIAVKQVATKEYATEGVPEPPIEPMLPEEEHTVEALSSRDASSTMVMDQDNIQQWIHEMGLTPTPEEEACIEDATATLAQAENAVDQGRHAEAIDLYLSLVRSFPQETQYQERLTELWAEVRQAEFDALPPQRSNTTLITGFLGAALFLVVLGWIWPGWFRSAPSQPPGQPVKRAKQVASPRQPVTPSPATLQINSTPSGAEIWLNGENTNHTTPAKFERPKGSYQLVLRLQGYREFQMDVSLRAGQWFAAQFALAPQETTPPKITAPGRRRKRAVASKRRGKKVSVRLETTPPGARIIKDGRYTKKRTPAALKLRPGRYQIQLRLKGYQTHIREIVVKANNPQGVSVPLSPKSTLSPLKVVSSPPGAEIQLNGRSTGRKTPAVLQVPAQELKLVVTLAGYRSESRQVTVRPKEAQTVTVRLRRAGPAGMVRVPGGPFWMGNNAGMSREKPMRRVAQRGFWIDRYEVTVADYQKCVQAKACRKPGRRPGCNARDKDRGQHPINCVSWYDARRYCRWAGKRLPTEAEWEKAARGKTPQLYPWGHDSPSCQTAHYQSCGEGTRPVGSLKQGRSPYGVYDMSGNVWEWVLDRFDATFYQKGPDKDPVNLTRGGKYRVIRGGAWNSPSDRLHVTFRSDFYVTRRTKTIGFRCAK